MGVQPERMQADLELSKGLIFTEAVMMALAPHGRRQKAQDLIYAISHQAVSGNQLLLDAESL
jgi:3-carboxy-cis,cis-muconate cycloisomerase